jgi:hypothetical protein
MTEHRKLVRALWEQNQPSWYKKPRPFDPDIAIANARQDLEDTYARYREQAVQAITQKNNLQQMVDDLTRKIDQLGEQAQLTEDCGDPERAILLRKEQEGYRVSKGVMAESLAEACEATEVVKLQVLLEQEAVNKRIAHLETLKTEWKASQVSGELGRQMQAEIQHRLFDENYVTYSLKAARDVAWVLLGIIATLLGLLLFFALR